MFQKSIITRKNSLGISFTTYGVLSGGAGGIFFVENIYA